MRAFGSKNFTYAQRKELHRCLQEGIDKKQIAIILHCHLATIYRELKRGAVNGAYDPDYSQKQNENSKKKRGKQKKLVLDSVLAHRIADLIINENLSPEQIIKRLKAEGFACPSKTTIYSAIYNGVIPNVSKDDLHKKTTTMFSNGLVMIPVWMRQKLKITDGVELLIRMQDDTIFITKNK